MLLEPSRRRALPMPDEAFTFRPVTEDDLATLHEWLGRPHVAEHWGPQPSLEEVAEKYLPRMTDPTAAAPYFALLGGEAVGYVQVYPAVETDTGWWPGQHDPGVKGIDTFLADGDRLGQGLGTRMVRAFVDFLFSDPEIHRIQIDPAPDNHRAIRCYEKAGFRKVEEITTPHGQALLMVVDRGS